MTKISRMSSFKESTKLRKQTGRHLSNWRGNILDVHHIHDKIIARSKRWILVCNLDQHCGKIQVQHIDARACTHTMARPKTHQTLSNNYSNTTNSYQNSMNTNSSWCILYLKMIKSGCLPVYLRIFRRILYSEALTRPLPIKQHTTLI